jgi:hypothetical protein
MGALQVESKLETAYQTLLNYTGGYIKTNSIARRLWGDNSQAKVTPCVIVHCNPAKPHMGFNGIYECELEIICVTNSVDDGNRAILKSIYECARGVLKDNSAATVTTTIVSGLTVDGIRLEAGSEDISEDGRLQQLTAAATIYCNNL